MKWYKYIWEHNDGDQDTQFQIMSQWLKKCEEMAEAERDTNLPFCSPLKQLIKLSCEKCPPMPGGKEHPYSKDKRISRRILTKVHSVYYTCLILWFTIFLQDFPLFNKPSIKILRSNCFFVSSFPYEGTLSPKSYIK